MNNSVSLSQQTVSSGDPMRRSGAAGNPTSAAVRLGFLGLGWIGLNRMQAVLDHPNAEIVAIADPSPGALSAARTLVPSAATSRELNELLRHDLDGVVVATPSGLHAEQVETALNHGVAVFCQKPLARTIDETERLIEAARGADRLLDVDFCYRHLAGMQQLRQLVQSGALGKLFSIDLVFHNAYGPDKAWATDLRQSGGGCVIDLATHLIDLAFWAIGDLAAGNVSSSLYRSGERLDVQADAVEDAAFAQWQLDGDIHSRLACSWNYSAGRDAEIKAAFHGTNGAAVVRNVEGSFYDFVTERYSGANSEQIAGPPDNWGGRALSKWITKLASGSGFDDDVERCRAVARLIDAIYSR